MLVRCVASQLTDDQKRQLLVKDPAADYQLQVGGEYLVLGITFMLPASPHGGGVRYEILNDYGKCRSVPAFLFELADRRVSKHWVARQDDDGALLLWPEAFYSKFFHDDLSEGEAQAVQMFSSVVELLRQEQGCHLPGSDLNS
jgi:hypothetical protein